MKKFLIMLISVFVIYAGGQVMFATQYIDVTTINFEIDTFLTFFFRSIVGITGSCFVVLGTQTAVFQLTGISLVNELKYYVLGSLAAEEENEKVGDK